ncbi:MAG: 50S ribosomal protein L24 [Aestuariivita sp.]|nr:50S ribosomal protein L24 [Aestuariivita sp.]
MAAKLKTGDRVIVLAGKDKGKSGEIVSVNTKTKRATVDSVNVAIKHTKQSQQSQGGLFPKPMPIDMSNLAVLDKNDVATRVGFRMRDGKKVRYAKTTGDEI